MDSLHVVERCVYAHGEQAWRLAVSLMGNASDADDVLQQSFIIAWRKAARFPPDDAWPWLAGIITREARNARRKRARRRHFPLTEAVAMTEPELDRTDLHILIQRALRRLPDDQREALLLTHIGGLTHAEAARSLRIPLNTLKARVRRGMDALRERLKRDEGELGRCLSLMPIAMPGGGMAAARVTWFAAVQQYAAVAAAGAGVVNVKLLAASAAVVLSAAALALWLLQDRPTINPPHVEVGEIEDHYTHTPWPRTEKGAARQGSTRGDERRGRRGTADGIPGEDDAGSPRRRPPTPGANSPAEDNAANDGAPQRANGPQPDTPATDETAREREDPAIANETTPVLWIADWPPSHVADRRARSTDAYFLSRFEQVWDNADFNEVDRLQATRELPHGNAETLPHLLTALAGPGLSCRAAATEWVAAETDRRFLSSLEQSLFDKETAQAVREQLLRGLYRNPNWVDEAKWQRGLKEWLYADEKGNSALAAKLLFEMGHVRGSLDDLETRDENRRRAQLLLEAAEKIHLDVKEKVKHTDQVIRSMHLALASLCQGGYVERKERDKVEKALRSRYATPNALMRRKRTYEVNGGSWDVTTIDVESPRLVDLPLVILQDPDTTQEAWLPWLVELDLHFRCYLVDYQSWGQDLEAARNNRFPAKYQGARQVLHMADQLNGLLTALGLEKVGLIAHGVNGPLGFELSRRKASPIVFAALEAWPHFEALEAQWRSREKDPFAAEVLRAMHDDQQEVTALDRLQAAEGQVRHWMQTRARGADNSPFNTTPSEMLNFRRTHNPHPLMLVSHYDFLGGGKLKTPAINLSYAFYPNSNSGRQYATWATLFDQQARSMDFQGSCLWKVSATVFAERLTELVEKHKLKPPQK